MKISLKWINELVDVSEYFAKTQELSDLLTAAGLEVEGIEDASQIFKNVVVGEVVTKDKHPDADKLSLCQVSTGEATHQIICGAKNHSAGDKVVVALPGAVLPGDFAIKKSKIRGVESFGMLCSDSELGLSDESDGIIILDKDAPLGEDFAKYSGQDDVFFELKVTPNRADCLSHIGLARELGTLLRRSVKEPKVQFKESSGDTQNTVSLEVRDTESCPRFTGRFIKGVKVQPSPAWLKQRLEALGINSINNVVDITNYVMMECGQPMHAYDASYLSGQKVIVERAAKGEKFVTFDGTELSLSGEELAIRDAEKTIGLAGIIGGKNSGVVDQTTDIFLECAFFVPQSIRRTSRKHGLDTDACYRFSRGVDPSAVQTAADRACSMILELAGGEAFGNPWDIYPNPIQRAAIELSVQLVNDRLGFEVSADEMKESFESLGCEVEASGENFKVLPPLYRWDLEHHMDLVEEIARLVGYDKIPEKLPNFNLEPTPHAAEYLTNNATVDLLSGLGFQQAVNHSFIGGRFQKTILGDMEEWHKFGLGVAGEAVPLKNPLNEELNTMRRSITAGLLKNLTYNYHHGNQHGALFEIGRVFGKNQKGPVEQNQLGLVIWGQSASFWGDSTAPPVMVLKSRLEAFFRRLNIKSYSFEPAPEVPSIFHPNQSTLIRVEGRPVGVLGTIHPTWREDQKVRSDAALVELQLDQLMARHPRIAKFSSISKFPSVARDLAFVVPDELVVGQVQKEMEKAAGKTLSSVDVVDLFRGESVGEGLRSITFRLRYQDLESTLDDSRVKEIEERIINAVNKRFSIQMR